MKELVALYILKYGCEETLSQIADGLYEVLASKSDLNDLARRQVNEACLAVLDAREKARSLNG